jgi:aminoglycoside phosphotransferase (APT) family kinase protein
MTRQPALAGWLSAHVNDLTGPVTIDRLRGGQSNLTLHVRSASGDCVVRAPPPGRQRGSHAIDREVRVLRALAGSGIPVPAVRAVCDDETVIGTTFYVMEYVPGRVITDPLLPGEDALSQRKLYDAMNEVLAAIHGFDWQGHGLDGFGRPGNYFARQVEHWVSSGTESPIDGRLQAWLAENIPDDETATVVHGDYRIGNLIAHPSEPRIMAVIDWELATIGHPLTDLAFNCMPYHLPAGHPVAPGFVGADLASLGVPAEEEYLALYAARTGIDPFPLWRFCMAFSLYRTAAIQRGIAARAVQGTAVSDDAHEFGATAQLVAEAGWRVASGLSG